MRVPHSVAICNVNHDNDRVMFQRLTERRPLQHCTLIHTMYRRLPYTAHRDKVSSQIKSADLITQYPMQAGNCTTVDAHDDDDELMHIMSHALERLLGA
jgi:hypothetical protein